MNYKMMGKFISQILFVEAAFMLPALLLSIVYGEQSAVRGFIRCDYYHIDRSSNYVCTLQKCGKAFLCTGRTRMCGNELDRVKYYGMPAVFYFAGNPGFSGCAV